MASFYTTGCGKSDGQRSQVSSGSTCASWRAKNRARRAISAICHRRRHASKTPGSRGAGWRRDAGVVVLCSVSPPRSGSLVNGLGCGGGVRGVVVRGGRRPRIPVPYGSPTSWSCRAGRVRSCLRREDGQPGCGLAGPSKHCSQCQRCLSSSLFPGRCDRPIRSSPPRPRASAAPSPSSCRPAGCRSGRVAKP